MKVRAPRLLLTLHAEHGAVLRFNQGHIPGNLRRRQVSVRLVESSDIFGLLKEDVRSGDLPQDRNAQLITVTRLLSVGAVRRQTPTGGDNVGEAKRRQHGRLAVRPVSRWVVGHF